MTKRPPSKREVLSAMETCRPDETLEQFISRRRAEYNPERYATDVPEQVRRMRLLLASSRDESVQPDHRACAWCPNCRMEMLSAGPMWGYYFAHRLIRILCPHCRMASRWDMTYPLPVCYDGGPNYDADKIPEPDQPAPPEPQETEEEFFARLEAATVAEVEMEWADHARAWQQLGHRDLPLVRAKLESRREPLRALMRRKLGMDDKVTP